jgi:hypothetical protein
MNLEAPAIDVARPALEKSGLNWHGWHAFRRGLATNLHRLGVSDKAIQQILRHANVVTTMNIYVKTASADAANAMKSLETMCATSVQPARLGSPRESCRSFSGRGLEDAFRKIWRRMESTSEPFSRD